MARAQGVVSKRRLEVGDAIRFGAATVSLFMAQYVAIAILFQVVDPEYVGWMLPALGTCGIAGLGFVAGRRESNSGLVGMVVAIAGFYLVLVGLPAVLSRIVTP